MTTDEERGARLQTAHAANPQAYPWGVRTSDPYPAGLMMFFWYESEEALRESLLSGDHVLDADDETRSEAVAALRLVLESSSPLMPASAEDGNKAAHPAFNIHWWGTFDDLCNGNHEDARDAREAFLEWNEENYGSPIEVPPIQPDARSDFAEFLQEWGI